MKHHFAISSEPLKEGTDVVALCLDIIPKAVFTAHWDTDLCAGYVEARWSDGCPKCRRSFYSGQRYVYVIAAGQEALTS